MTPFVCDKTPESVLDELEGNSKLAIFWFENNYMKLNTDKCHLLVSGTKYEHSRAKISDYKIWESKKVKLLSLTLIINLNLTVILQVLASKPIKN